MAATARAAATSHHQYRYDAKQNRSNRLTTDPAVTAAQQLIICTDCYLHSFSRVTVFVLCTAEAVLKASTTALAAAATIHIAQSLHQYRCH